MVTITVFAISPSPSKMGDRYPPTREPTSVLTSGTGADSERGMRTNWCGWRGKGRHRILSTKEKLAVK